jgi:predicted nucleic acid-binding protein
MATEQIICDSDVMIEYFDKQKGRHNQTADAISKIGLDNVLLSAITQMELIKGITNKESGQVVYKKLKRFNLVLLSPDITLLAIELLNTYHLSHGLAIPDALIAATALETNLKLYTYNQKDFKFIKGLKLHKVPS